MILFYSENTLMHLLSSCPLHCHKKAVRNRWTTHFWIQVWWNRVTLKPLSPPNARNRRNRIWPSAFCLASRMTFARLLTIRLGQPLSCTVSSAFQKHQALIPRKQFLCYNFQGRRGAGSWEPSKMQHLFAYHTAPNKICNLFLEGRT